MAAMSPPPPSADVHALFCHYNALYFKDALGPCFVSWSSSLLMHSCPSTCDYHPEGGCEIRLSEPLLRPRSVADVKNVLLHEMIHAFLWVVERNTDHSDHDEGFVALMDEINSSIILDHEKPLGGYNINVNHTLPEEVEIERVCHWICGTCGDSIQRTMEGEPSADDCIGNVSHDESCGNAFCKWHRHKKFCSGSYIKKEDSSGYRDERISPKGELELQNNRFKGIHYRRTSLGSCIKEEMNADTDGKKEITLLGDANRNFTSVGDANRKSGCNSSDDGSQRKIQVKDSKGMIPKDECHVVAPSRAKRTRAPVSKKKSICLRKRRKSIKSKVEYNLIIEWLSLYTDEEDEEEVEPLINKRTERRKKLKLLKTNMVREQEDLLLHNASSSCGIEENRCTDDTLMCSKSAKEHNPAGFLGDEAEKQEMPIDVTSEPKSGKIQPHAEDNTRAIIVMESSQLVCDMLPLNVSSNYRDVNSPSTSCVGLSPSNSPIRHAIMDISDG